MMKGTLSVLLILLSFQLMVYGQSRTTTFSLPLWNTGDVLRAGSSTDTSTANAGINSLSLRTEKFFNRWFDRSKDSLRNVSYIRFNNGMRMDGFVTTNGLYLYNGYLYIIPSTSIGEVFYPYGVGAGNTSALVFNELAANGTNYVGFKAPDNIVSNVVWTLPGSDGTSGQFLQTNGSGVCTWGTPATGIASVNGLTSNAQTFTTGSYGSDFSISSYGSVHTFSLPTVGVGRRGVLSTGTDTITGTKLAETILPRTDNGYDLGSSTNIWSNINAVHFVAGRSGTGGSIDLWDNLKKATIQPASLTSSMTYYLPNTDPITLTPTLGTINGGQDYTNIGAITTTGTFTMNYAQSTSAGVRLNRTVTTKSLWDIYLLQSSKNLIFRDSASNVVLTLNYGGGATLLGGLSLGTPLTPTNGGTGLNSSSSTGVPSVSSGTWSINSTMSNTLGGTGQNSSSWSGIVRTSSGTWSASSLIDTLTKGGGFYSIALKDSFTVWEVRDNALTLTEIRAVRTGGVADTINCTRTRSGTTVDLLTANYSTTTSAASAGTVQNTTLFAGDIIKCCVRGANSTAAQEVFIQLTYTKTR